MDLESIRSDVGERRINVVDARESQRERSCRESDVKKMSKSTVESQRERSCRQSEVKKNGKVQS